MEIPLSAELLCSRFDAPGVRAIVIMGSYAWGSPTLVDQIKAGLQLYVATAELLDDALLSQDKPLVQETVELIIEVIGLPSSGLATT